MHNCYSCKKFATCMAKDLLERVGCFGYEENHDDVDQVVSGSMLNDLRKASEILNKNSEAPIDYYGYNVIVNPIVGECIKGFKKTEEDRRISLIRSITVNKRKRLITVVFRDGCVEIIKCHKEDHFDVNVGVALAIAKHLYGSKNKFHKEVERRTRRKSK